MQDYLITIADFRTLTPVSFNLDEQWINGLFDYCQFEIGECVGGSLVLEILDQINTNTLTVLNEALLALIKPVYAWLLYSECVRFASYRMENKGMAYNLDSSNAIIPNGTISQIKLDAKAKSDYYKLKLVAYLNENHLLYPLFPYNVDCRLNKGCSTTFPLFV